MPGFLSVIIMISLSDQSASSFPSPSKISSIIWMNIFLVSSGVLAIPLLMVGFPSSGMNRNAGMLRIPNTEESSRSTSVSTLYI